MNGNRSKYTTIPTYGVQKRGVAEKLGIGQRQMKEVPDFSQRASGMPAAYTEPMQPAYTGPSQSVRQNPSYLNNVQAPVEKQNSVVLQQPRVSYPPQQMPAAQNVQPGQNSQTMGYNPMYYPPVNTATNTFAVNSQNPVGYTQFQQPTRPTAANTAPGYRGQGYVPQQQMVQPKGVPNFQSGFYQQAGNMNMPMGYAGVQPQTANYVNQQPYQNVQQPVQAQQQQQFAQALSAQNPPVKKKKPSPSPKKKQTQMDDSERLIGMYLVAVLPMVFAISLFQTPVFYAFIALAVLGLGVVWYRDMYGQTMRLVISGVAVAMCIYGIISISALGSSRGLNTQASYAPNIQVTAAPVSNPDYGYDGNTDLLEPTLEPIETPEPVVEVSEAEIRLCAFMDLWKVNNAEVMSRYVQPSWASKQTDAAQALFIILANRTVEDYTIEEVGGSDADTSRTITLTATINKNTGKAATIYRFTIMMVKEGDEWYVNPNSLATNDEVATAKTDDVVVNDSYASGKVTEAPRTTVTPPPPASTLIYYNPSGGSKYHLDPNCPSVDKSYLPLQGSFSYRDLKSYKSELGLSPCLKCGAPSNPLPEDQQ